MQLSLEEQLANEPCTIHKTWLLPLRPKYPRYHEASHDIITTRSELLVRAAPKHPSPIKVLLGMTVSKKDQHVKTPT